MGPLVSVVVGVFDGRAYLAEALESVLAQTYDPLELIVVDDGSTDDSAEVAEAAIAGAANARMIRRASRGGIGAGRNTGVSAAAGDYLAFLDADDRFPVARTTVMTERLAADAGLDAVFGQVNEFLSPDLSPQDAAEIRAPHEKITGRLAPTMLIRRGAFDDVGPFSETLAIGVGLDWFARASDLGLRSVVLEDVVYERRLHRSNNGLLQSDSRMEYAEVLKASIDRRRTLDG